jgi:hypothetical protein
VLDDELVFGRAAGVLAGLGGERAVGGEFSASSTSWGIERFQKTSPGWTIPASASVAPCGREPSPSSWTGRSIVVAMQLTPHEQSSRDASIPTIIGPGARCVARRYQ